VRRRRDHKKALALGPGVERDFRIVGGLKAFLLLMWSGSRVAVPFSLRENGHMSLTLLITHRRNAPAARSQLEQRRFELRSNARLSAMRLREDGAPVCGPPIPGTN
jgi:hypothetical protein